MRNLRKDLNSACCRGYHTYFISRFGDTNVSTRASASRNHIQCLAEVGLNASDVGGRERIFCGSDGG